MAWHVLRDQLKRIGGVGGISMAEFFKDLGHESRKSLSFCMENSGICFGRIKQTFIKSAAIWPLLSNIAGASAGSRSSISKDFHGDENKDISTCS